jgi:hypothetical protein
MQRNKGAGSASGSGGGTCLSLRPRAHKQLRAPLDSAHALQRLTPHRLASQGGTLAGRRAPQARGHAVCACHRRQPPSPRTGCRRSRRRSRCAGRTPRRAARLHEGRPVDTQQGRQAGQASEEGWKRGLMKGHVVRAGNAGAFLEIFGGMTTAGGKGGQAGSAGRALQAAGCAGGAPKGHA